MSFQFPCPKCNKRLSISDKKVGASARCPKCKKVLTVPTKEDAAEAMDEYRRERTKSGKTEEEDEVTNPFADLIVYDDDDPNAAYHYEYENEETVAVDRSRVSVPRSVIYFQGALIGTLALLTFVVGLLVGGSGGNGTIDDLADRTPVKIPGYITYTAANGRQLPDDGAVMIAIPRSTDVEGNKLKVHGLSPAEPPQKDHESVLAIRKTGGAYVRSGEDGKFATTLLPGKYNVLLISHNAQRKIGKKMNTKDLAALSDFFANADAMVGQYKYDWRVRTIKAEEEITKDFGENRK